MGNLRRGPNRRLSLSFQDISLFLNPFNNVIIAEDFFFSLLFLLCLVVLSLFFLFGLGLSSLELRWAFIY